jgi:ABC-2 type transport system ATP-binding protein
MSISIKDICKNYGSQPALSHVSFEVMRGQVVGLLGTNGAGKSTMMKILAGFIPPTSGEAFVNRLNVAQNTLAAQRQVGYLPEHNPLYLDMYVVEFLEFVARTYGLNRTAVNHRLKNVLDITGLLPEKTKKIGQLSKGYRQRVGLAQALVHNPQVLILDEPTSGLDPHQLVEIRQLIAEIGKEKTVLLSTHIMQEVEAVCSRVIIVDKGKIVADDTPADVRRQSQNASFASVAIELSEPTDAAQWQQLDFVARAEQISDTSIVIFAKNADDIRPSIFNHVVKSGWTLLSMQQQQKQLEEVFRELTHK